jgi:hypothetical protein
MFAAPLADSPTHQLVQLTTPAFHGKLAREPAYIEGVDAGWRNNYVPATYAEVRISH